MIVGFYCQTHRANVALDHFDHCGAVHPDYIAAVLADSRKDRGDGVHVTSALSCPRRSAIEQQADVFIDPLGLNAPLGGTAWHALMEKTGDPQLCEVDVAGTIGGVRVVGRIDRLHPPTAISDWKTTSEFAEKWLSKSKSEGGGMKTEHLAQLSLYAELVEQSLGWRPQQGIVWYRTHKTMLHFAEPLWDLQTVLAFKPLNGDFSVAELISQCDHFNQWQGGKGALRTKWQDLPLAGESMKYGNKLLCDYCGVREICYTQARGAPF